MNSNKHFLFLYIISLGIFYSTEGQAQSEIQKDKSGNIYPVKIMPDGKTWMITNLDVNIPGSYCYDNSKQNCQQYARLYIWTSAQEGCKLLGQGWHLPTIEEWKQMTTYFGGPCCNAADSGRAAYHALLPGGQAEFDALLGGGRGMDGDSYARIDAHGFYWTATETDSANAVFMNFGKGAQKLFVQNEGEKPRAFSVRCVKDAGE